MNKPKALDDLSTQAIDIVTEAHRTGIEVGLRRGYGLPTGTVIMNNPYVLHSLIAKLDKEFSYLCPCTRFKDGKCERCGKSDPFGVKES